MRHTTLVPMLLIAAGLSACQSPGLVTRAGDGGAAAPAFLSDGAPQTPPPGAVSFCIRFPAQCRDSAPAAVPLTAKLIALLTRVDVGINRAIQPETDRIHYGRADYWTLPRDGRGDCEDYALAKRRVLIADGLPQGALRLALVKTWDGERHAVLTIATSGGDFVLDDANDRVRPWWQADYRWIARQSGADPHRWYGLKAPLRLAARPR